MKELRCPKCRKLLGKATGTEYKLLLHCRRCKKIWLFHGKDSIIVSAKEQIKVRAPKSASE